MEKNISMGTRRKMENKAKIIEKVLNRKCCIIYKQRNYMEFI